jgi:hypothetical protein
LSYPSHSAICHLRLNSASLRRRGRRPRYRSWPCARRRRRWMCRPARPGRLDPARRARGRRADVSPARAFAARVSDAPGDLAAMKYPYLGKGTARRGRGDSVFRDVPVMYSFSVTLSRPNCGPDIPPMALCRPLP